MLCKPAILNRTQTITDSIKARARLITITGRVQGVWFRDSTRREAERLGISGYAKNLANGDVEVLASGPDAAVDELVLWLRDGPPLAKVSKLEERPAVPPPTLLNTAAGFEII